ncbi:MAG: glycerophosphoryl diester phosphodiesterase [Acidimicrobiales bacterium]|nr:glycerophosphoryl diester phosphodiesterase [Acidimicrobiales bacterium]
MAFAHRGGSDGGHPENSIAAFADALGRGCEIESDVRLAADGEPVLVHDAIQLQRGMPVAARWMPSRWLRRLGIPALADLYRELGRDYELSLDLKDPAAVRATLDVARRAGATGRLWLVHDELDVLDRIRSTDGSVKLVHEARHDDLARAGRSPASHVAALASHRIDAKNTHWGDWTPELIDVARAAGVQAFGSLVEERAAMDAAAGLGLDALYSDHLDALVAAIDANGPGAG